MGPRWGSWAPPAAWGPPLESHRPRRSAAGPATRPRSPPAPAEPADAPGAADACGLPRSPHSPPASARSGPDRHRLVVLACLTVVLAFPYLSAHEVQVASRASATSSSAALDDLRLAAKLNPLSSDPGRLAGAIALRNGRWTLALRQFRNSLSAEPGGWFSWLGAGLAESALGEPEQAHRDFVVAKRINARQPAVQDALQRVFSKSPLTSDEAFKLLVLLQ